MQLISLNAWGGKIFEPLINFIKDHSAETDIFCIQEVFNGESNIKEFKGFRVNLLDELKSVLKGFNYFYCVRAKNWIPGNLTKEPFEFGQALFAKDNIKTENYGELLIYKGDPNILISPDGANLPIILQYLTINLNDGNNYLIGNFHGISVPGNKLDTPLRMEQSKKISEFLKSRIEKKIICGDFNLMPQTQSMSIIEENGMTNLIKKYNIKDTRGPLNIFKKKINEQRFADYIFTSSNIKVNSFGVPEIPISDHLPMILNF